MIKEIHVSAIADAVEKLFIDACVHLGAAETAALEKAAAEESSPSGKQALEELVANACIARETGLPLCQDTGMAVVFIDCGQDVHITGGALEDAVNLGVRRAYDNGNLRKSVLDPLTRINTGDNTPAILHTRIIPGDTMTITAAPKGFGSENMSRLIMLTPAAGREGVLDFIVETVRLAGANPCPPVIVGVGIGGTMEMAAIMAKRALLRDVGQASSDPDLAQMEEELLLRINGLGIGPRGLGGSVTALGVHILSHPTHIAGLPVAVNMQCHSARHKCVTL